MTQSGKEPPNPTRKAALPSVGQRAPHRLPVGPVRRVQRGAPDAVAQLTPPADVSFSTLPPYRMGPYQLRIVPATRDMFLDKRRKVETDWNAGIVHFRQDANESFALTLIVRHLITAIHYRSGLNDSSDEESYTHSFASGLVELVLSQREFLSNC